MMTRIHVTAKIVGFHCWPDAPKSRDYLAAKHRHIFHVTVAMDVVHDQRDVEFHDLLDFIAGCWPLSEDWHSDSCESIARTILGDVVETWPDRNAAVTVSEDGEAGATVEEGP